VLNLTTDIRAPQLADKFCGFGLTEVILPLVIGGLTAAGGVAGTAAIGAGIGGLTAALTGGKVLKGMGYGALAGGALGTGLGAFGAVAPETAASLGLGGIGAAGGEAAGAVGAAAPAATGAMESGALASSLDPVTAAAYGLPEAATAAPGVGALEAATGLDPVTAAAYGVPSGGAAAGAGAGAVPGSVAVTPEIAGTNVGGFMGAGAGASSPGALSQALNYARLAGAAGSLFAGQPGAPNYGNLPGPSTTAATQGPFFNAPLSSFGSFNRTPVQNYTPNSGGPGNGNPTGNPYYTYGEYSQSNRPFFNNNSVGIGNTVMSPFQQPLRMAQGGALAHVLFRAGMHHGARMAGGGALSQMFDSQEQGGGAVQGEGSGLEDKIPARLSQDEFVLSASDVSRIGGGSSNEGVKRLNQMRKDLAKDVGASKLVQGKPKLPMQYLRKAS